MIPRKEQLLWVQKQLALQLLTMQQALWKSRQDGKGFHVIALTRQSHGKPITNNKDGKESKSVAQLTVTKSTSEVSFARANKVVAILRTASPILTDSTTNHNYNEWRQKN